MNLNIVFRFWPVRAVGVCDGWVYGTYSDLKYVPYKEVLKEGRLRWESQRRGQISQASLERSFRKNESLSAVREGRTLLETNELEEAQFTNPVTVVSQEKADRALLEFLNIPYGDELGAIQYVNDFGEFNDLVRDDREVEHRSEIPSAIRQFFGECKKISCHRLLSCLVFSGLFVTRLRGFGISR